MNNTRSGTSRRRSRLIVAVAVACASAACHKAPEKPKSPKRKREDAIMQASAEQRALDKLTDGVRDVLRWAQTQPVTTTAAERQNLERELAQRMEQIPTKGLNDDLAKAWQRMLDAWKELAKSETPDAALRDKGAKAAAELNRQLEAHGVMDLKF